MYVEEYRHQVGGHCKLIKPKDSSKVYKPLIENEYIFYEKLRNFRSSSTESGPLHILKKFIPKFYGVTEIVIESCSDLDEKLCVFKEKRSKGVHEEIEKKEREEENKIGNYETNQEYNKNEHRKEIYKKYVKLNEVENNLDESNVLKHSEKSKPLEDKLNINNAENIDAEQVEQVVSLNYKWLGINDENENGKKGDKIYIKRKDIVDIEENNLPDKKHSISNDNQENNTSNQIKKRKECIPHIVLEDLVYGFKRPCVLDIKMGKRQRKIGASSEKKKRQVEKSFKTTSHSLGFRLCGCQNYNKRNDKLFYRDKYWGRKLSKEKITGAIRNWLWNGTFLYEELVPLLLEKLHSFFNCIVELRHYRFWSSSLLWVFDGGLNDKKARSNSLDIRMIDFANTIYLQDNPSPDDEYIFGLKNLIESIQILHNSLYNIYFLPYEIAASFFSDDYNTKVDWQRKNLKKCGSVNFEEKNQKNKKTVYINWPFLENGRKCISEAEHDESNRDGETAEENVATDSHMSETSEETKEKKRKKKIAEIKKIIKIIKWKGDMKKPIQSSLLTHENEKLDKKIDTINGNEKKRVSNTVGNDCKGRGIDSSNVKSKETKDRSSKKKTNDNSKNNKKLLFKSDKISTVPLNTYKREKNKKPVLTETGECCKEEIFTLSNLEKSDKFEKKPNLNCTKDRKNYEKQIETQQTGFFKKKNEKIEKKCQITKNGETEEEIIQDVINRILKNIFQIRKFKKQNIKVDNDGKGNNRIKYYRECGFKNDGRWQKQLITMNSAEYGKSIRCNNFSWNQNQLCKFEKERNVDSKNNKNELETEKKKLTEEMKKKILNRNVRLKVLINQIIKFETKKKERENNLLSKSKKKERKGKATQKNVDLYSDSNKNNLEFQKRMKNRKIRKFFFYRKKMTTKTNFKITNRNDALRFMNYNSDFFIIPKTEEQKWKKKHKKKRETNDLEINKSKNKKHYVLHFVNSSEPSKRCCSCVNIHLKSIKHKTQKNKRKNKNISSQKINTNIVPQEKHKINLNKYKYFSTFSKHNRFDNIFRNKNEKHLRETSSSEFNIYTGKNINRHFFKNNGNYQNKKGFKTNTILNELNSKNLIVPLKETNENYKYLRKSLSEPNFHKINNWRYEPNYLTKYEIICNNLKKNKNDKLKNVSIFKQICEFHSDSEDTDSSDMHWE